MTGPERTPLLVPDGGRTLAVLAALPVATGLVLFLALRDPLLRLAGDATSLSPAVGPVLGTLLGWLPVGGLATYAAAYLAWRAERLRREQPTGTLPGRAMLTGLLVWIGLAISNLPHDRTDALEQWRAEIARPGPEFAQAASWCCWTVLLMAAWALVPAVLTYRGRTVADPPPAYVRHRMQAAILAPPFLVLLVVLLAT